MAISHFAAFGLGLQVELDRRKTDTYERAASYELPLFHRNVLQ